VGRERLRLGAYDVLFELSAGGMATVYLARKAGAAGFERLVVLKRIHRHLLRDPDLRDMLRDEAKIASLIVHPHVVGVDDVIEHDGELILAQPYVESVALSTLIRAARDAGERLPPAIVVRIACDVLAGLHAAHEARDLRGDPLHVVHRDVSPHNILVGADGVSRLIDFGIAKAERRVTTTESGILKGKIGYMAPEVLRRAPVDRRADVFAAGVTIHEALTGKKPFDGGDEADVLLAIVVAEVDPPSVVEPSVPAALDGPTLAALARSPEDRTGTAAELGDALQSAVAPASPREVAAVVQRLCGAALADVRARVRASIDEPTEATALVGGRGPEATASAGGQGPDAAMASAGGRSPDAATASAGGRSPDAATASAGGRSPDAVAPADRRARPTAVFVGAGVIGAILAIVLLLLRGSRAADSAPSPRSDSPSGQALSGQAPSEQALSKQAPTGQALTGQAPSGQAPSEQAPSGQALSGSTAVPGAASGRPSASSRSPSPRGSAVPARTSELHENPYNRP